ncbi:MAG: cobalamin-dependent protein [Candidatus Adiutrix sp.]|jgi:methanogenic corrinoid protein MtbC1|nr:cobalamin-dependent protein [Candidatus Adiutrix sp.]
METKHFTAPRTSNRRPNRADKDGQRLVAAMADLDEDLSLEVAAALLDKVSGKEILHLALEGLNTVGKRYEAGEYYVAGLVMAGEIMRQVLHMVAARSPHTVPEREKAGVVVLGTVEGDIHDLGKDMVKEVLTANGFEVHDLGVDVAPELYLAESIRLQPDLVGLSILISTSYPALSKAVTQLRTLIPAGFKRPGVIIGGGAVDETVFEHIKADLWCRDLTAMGDLCRRWIAQRNGLMPELHII